MLLATLDAGCGRSGDPSGTTRSIAASSAVEGRPGRGTPCGALGCRQYGSTADAFLDALASNPLVLAVGEVHAPSGATVRSAARRFSEDLLPLLAGRASDLLLESMLPPKGCQPESVEARSKQRVITSRQAPTDQGEYVALGERARTFGLVPDMLRPDCADIDVMRGLEADDAIGATLEVIARLTAGQAKALVRRDALSDTDRGKMVVIYGGALHNDLAPRPEAARWSYAPELSAYVQGRFVALDLIVPEFIRDDETWRALPWWPAYQVERLGSRPTLLQSGERSFVLVFAKTPP